MRRTSAWTYAGLAACLVVMVGATATAATTAFGGSTTLCADFRDTVGLYEGNDVTLLGIAIGTVTDIEPLGDRMRVSMSLDRGITVSADVGAVTMSSSIVTDRHVELTKPYTGGPEFDIAGCIPLDRTKTPLGMSEAFDAVNSLTGDLLGPEPNSRPDTVLATTLNSLDASLSGTAPLFNRLLERLSTVIGDPAGRDVVVRRLISNLDRLTTMFVTNWPDFASLLDNLTNGLAVVDGVSSGLGGAVAKANAFLPVIARTVDKYDEQSYAFLDRAVPFVDRLLARAGDINDLLSYLPEAARDLQAMITGEAPR